MYVCMFLSILHTHVEVHQTAILLSVRSCDDQQAKYLRKRPSNKGSIDPRSLNENLVPCLVV